MKRRQQAVGAGSTRAVRMNMIHVDTRPEYGEEVLELHAACGHSRLVRRQIPRDDVGGSRDQLAEVPATGKYLAGFTLMGI